MLCPEGPKSIPKYTILESAVNGFGYRYLVFGYGPLGMFEVYDTIAVLGIWDHGIDNYTVQDCHIPTLVPLESPEATCRATWSFSPFRQFGPELC